ncbi:MAG: DUF1800 domain-containing protein [Pseudomonadota bacterium]
MRFDPHFADMRFGFGLSPSVAPPVDAAALLDGLHAPDEIAQRFPVEPYQLFQARMVESQRLMKQIRKTRGTPENEIPTKARRLVQKDARQAMRQWLVQSMLRRAYTPDGFRERLVAFWADHFAARGKAGVMRRATSPYIEDAIRPFVAGRFSDLLQSAVMHPLMLHYLDQDRSVGPNSKRGKVSNGRRGLNENLAREVLELHTLGVGSAYTQDDVRQLAELFTGMSSKAPRGFKFRKDFVEPGSETVLGITYDDALKPAPIRAALEDLSVHPDTARHLARKLAVHFVSDQPPRDLVDHMTARYRETDGDMTSVYAALLEHPAAWQREGANMKTPAEFVGSALRALAPNPGPLQALKERQVQNLFFTPMAVMGQAWQRFDGPDGWPEEDDAWVTPAGVVGRVQWAMGAPRQMLETLPDPRAFVDTALGPYAADEVRFAAGAAESVPEAIGIVLMSPAFQRR